MKHAPTQPRRSGRARARKRNAILDAAERTFGEHGYQKTSMRDVADAAGVSRPLLYRYFRDKSGLLSAVVERVLEEWNEVLVAEAARATPSTAQTVRLVLVASLEFARDRRVLRGLLAGDSKQALSDAGDVIARGSDLLRDLMRDILAAGVRRGEVRSDLDLDDLAHVVTEVFLAYADHVVQGDEQLGERRVKAILETLLHGFVAKPASAS
jgi:AcrR family transcriptional regulator